MRITAIIPARIGSSRFPAKALALLDDKPIINHVWQRVQASGIFGDVIVATDSQLIIDAVTEAGGKARMTAADHPSGSDRVAEVARTLDADIIVNVQGDEPFITPAALKTIAGAFTDPTVQMASLMCELVREQDWQDPNVVKVITDLEGNALYFSRAAIPFDRDHSASALRHVYRHIGIYAWRKETLLRFVSLPPSPLENIEKLEQLRALENGIPIRMLKTDFEGFGIDTPADLQRAQEYIKKEQS